MLFALASGDLLASVVAAWADVMAQMGLARSSFNSQWWSRQEIVCTVHSALGRGLLILLNCHTDTPKKL
jgi:hypothetical protein